MHTARFKVMDDERLKDDLAGWACYRLDHVQRGYRMLHLYNSRGEMTNGVVFIRVKMNLDTVASVTKAVQDASLKV